MELKPKPKDFQVLFLDMDSYFASVEQQIQPPLRGKPVGVTPYVGNTGCIIAASKEAKKIGIKTGFRVGEAKNLCPKIKIVESRPTLYMLYHQEIKKILESFSPFYEALSVDEFILRLSPDEQNKEKVLQIALKLKNRIKEEVGDWLTCSVGIGPNRFLAKMAAEENKPDGLKVLSLNNLSKFYAEIEKLTDLTGINHQLEALFLSLGVATPLQLYQKELFKLEKFLNHWGKLWYFRLRGYEVDEVISKTKSIGHSHVLAPEFRNPKGAKSVIRKLVMKAAKRLREGKFLASGVSISISFMNHTYFAQNKKVNPFCDSFSFLKNISQLLEKCPWSGKPILVAINAYNLLKMRNFSQISLFERQEKVQKFSQAQDKINDKFGQDTLYPASVYLAKDSAPDRIPFGKPRYDMRNF